MKRFVRKAAGTRKSGTAVLITVICIAAAAALFLYAMNRVDSGSINKQEESLEEAVNRDITICYAEEGRYPASLEYIVDNYGLTYDSDMFTVKYQVRGANIRPYVTIIRNDGKNAAGIREMSGS